MAVGTLFALAGTLGLLSYFGRRAGRLGQVGLFLSCVGSLTALVGIVGLGFSDSSPWWEMSMLGITSNVLGIGFFGINCLRFILFSRWNYLPLLASTPWIVTILISLAYRAATNTDLQIPELIILIEVLVTFAGLTLTGYLLQSEVANAKTVLT